MASVSWPQEQDNVPLPEMNEALQLSAEEASVCLSLNPVMTGTKSHKGLRSRLQHDLQFRRKFIRSSWLCLCFFSLGIGGGQRGPAFLDLQLITNTSVQQASAFFTAGSAGYITGCVLSGFVYDFLSQSLLLAVSLMSAAVVTAATPFCSPYWLMVAILFLGAACGGGIDTACNADVLRTWEGRGEAALQAIHFSFAVGGVVAPLFTEPFLAPTPEINPTQPTGRGSREQVGHANAGALVNGSEGTSAILPSLSNHRQQGKSGRWMPSAVPPVWRERLDSPVTPLAIQIKCELQEAGEAAKNSTACSTLPSLLEDFVSNRTSNSPEPLLPQQTRVHFAFLISACVALLAALPFIVEYCQSLKRTTKQQSKAEEKTKQRLQEDVNLSRMQLPKMLYVIALLWICAFFMLYVAVEDTFGVFLTFYVVHQMKWSKSQGALLTSVFWISFALSRFVCIFLARVFSATQLLLSCFALLIVSYLGFLLSSVWTLHWGVWVSSALGGAAMSAVFPSGLSWTGSQLLPVTGRVTSAIMFASSLGPIVNPVVLGHLMESRGVIWLAYLLLGEATLCVSIFLLLLLFRRLYLRRMFTNPCGRLTINGSLTVHRSETEQSQSFLDEKRDVEEAV